MLDSLRKGAGSWAAKLLLLLLIVSFGVWGIADVYTGFGRQTLASVGGREITVPEFERAYQAQLNAISGRVGRQLTAEEIRALAVPQQVLSRLVSGAAVDLHAEALGLGVTDAAVAEEIRSNQAFQDGSGNFSRQRFEQILRSAGLTEQRYVNETRTEIIRNQIIGTLAANAVVPTAMLEAINRYQNETRTLSYFVLPEKAAGDIAAPTDDQISSYYDENKGEFTLPEYRKVVFVEISPESLSDRIEVSEDDIKTTYELRKDQFGTPERRRIEQIAFPDLAAAQAAYDRIAQEQADFAQIASEMGFKDTDIDLGMKTRRELVDAKVADAAFALKKDEVSKPVEGALSTVLVRVREIVPGETKTLDQVRDVIRRDLALEKAKSLVTDISNKMEDGRAAGTPLSEIAKSLALPLRETTLARDGTQPAGATGASLPRARDLLKGIFETEVGEESYPAALEGGGSVYYDVTEIIPSRVQPLQEVRDRVVASWRKREVRNRLAAKAQELVAQASGPHSLADLAKPYAAEVKTTRALKRNDSESGVPSAAIAQAFTLAQGQAGSVAMADGGRLIFVVASITPPAALDEAQAAQLRRELDNALATDYVAQYLAALQSGYGVRVNTAAFARLTGQAEQ